MSRSSHRAAAANTALSTISMGALVGLDQREDGRHAGGNVDAVLISAEDTGSYGAVMADLMSQTGYRVVEAPVPSAKRLRGDGKTDALDAITTVPSTLVMDVNRPRNQRAGELQTALKVLTIAREQMNADRLRSINALTALLRTHDLGGDARGDARKALTLTQIGSVAAWRRREEPLSLLFARATRSLDLHRGLKGNRGQVTKFVT